MAIFLRMIAGIVGGYVVANATAILYSFVLTGSQTDRLLTSMLTKLLIYAFAFLWVFSARTVYGAWVGVLIPSITSTTIIFLIWPRSFF